MCDTLPRKRTNALDGRTHKQTMYALSRINFVSVSGQSPIAAEVGTIITQAGINDCLGLAEAGWLPVVLRECAEVVYDHIPLDDVRPGEWHVPQVETPTLPNPPPGELRQDYRG